MRTSSHLVLLALPILVIFAAPVLAHDWQCPTEVRASSDGTFQFDVVLVIQDVPVYNGYYSELGTENVDDVNLVADGFCMAEMPVGTELPWTVHGTLTDPQQPGTVHIEQYVCGIGDMPDGFWERDVIILPAVVATEESSFGMLKARFAE